MLTNAKHLRKPDRQVFVSEAIIRPTGLLDPEIFVRPTANQVDDVLEEIRKRKEKKQRVLITTLTKKFAEELDNYFKQLSIKSTYLHSDIDTLERVEILKGLRSGVYDVLIGINLLREGLDLPEVSLVAIYDADKEGFLRSKTSLIQIIGRAARHQEGQVIMYADTITPAMQEAIEETRYRRAQQAAYNQKHGIIPRSAIRTSEDLNTQLQEKVSKDPNFGLANSFLGTQGLVLKNRKTKSRERTWSPVTTDTWSLDQIPINNRFSTNADLAFQNRKDFYLKQLKNLSIGKEELKKRQQIAIAQNNFEEAAAIQELLG